MENEQIRQVRTFFDELTNYPFLLKGVGVCNQKDALKFLKSFQEEEQIYEHFLTGLISQSVFYPVEVNKWLNVARLCNYNHPAILDERIDLTEGGPVSDWYIYPKFIKWLIKNAPNKTGLDLDKQDQDFLDCVIPEAQLSV